MSRQEVATDALQRDRAAKLNLKVIQAAKRESRKPVMKVDNPVLAAASQELHNEKVFECACLLSASPKPKHVQQASELFEQLINRDFRAAECRRRWGLLLYLEGRYRAAARQLSHPDLPPATEPLVDDVWPDEIRNWSLELEPQERAQQIKDYRAKLKAEFDPKSLIQARALHLRGDENATLEFAILLSRSATKQHQEQALALFDGLANKDFRRPLCAAHMGVLHALADRLVLAQSLLKESVPLLQDGPFHADALLALEWANGGLEELARSDPTQVAEREARDKLAEEERRRKAEERKLRDDQRLQIQQEQYEKTEAIRMSTMGKSQEEVKQLHKLVEEEEILQRAAKLKDEQEKLRLEEELRALQLRQDELKDTVRAQQVAFKLFSARKALPANASTTLKEAYLRFVAAQADLATKSKDLREKMEADALLSPEEKAAQETNNKLARIRGMRTNENFVVPKELLTLEELEQAVALSTATSQEAQQAFAACGGDSVYAEKQAEFQAAESDFQTRAVYFTPEQLERIQSGVKATERSSAAEVSAQAFAQQAEECATRACTLLTQIEAVALSARAEVDRIEELRIKEEALLAEAQTRVMAVEESLMLSQEINPGDQVHAQYTDNVFYPAVIRARASKTSYLVWFPILNVECEVLASQLEETTLTRAPTPEDEEKARFVARLTNGHVFLKHGGHFGKPQYRFVCVSADLTSIVWGPTEEVARSATARMQPCSELSAVLAGRQSSRFVKGDSSTKKKATLSQEEELRESRSFSLVFGASKTLDLEVTGWGAERDAWVSAFSWLWQAHQALKADQEVSSPTSRSPASSPRSPASSTSTPRSFRALWRSPQAQ